MPEISLDMVQTVALGPFNPRIIEPDWLIQEGVCEEKTFDGYDLLPDDEGDSEEMFRFGGMEWQVNYSRLAVSSRRQGLDTGKPVGDVIRKLHHTPVRAVGNNFHFSCAWSEWDQSKLPQLGSDQFPPLEEVAPSQTRWRASYARGDCITEVQLAIARNEGLAIILFNHERKIESPNSEVAMNAANRFQDDWEVTKKVLRSLFAAQVKS